MKSFYRFVLVTFVVSLLVLAGCESLENFSAKWSDSTAKTVQTVGNVAAPFTGGISSLVAGTSQGGGDTALQRYVQILGTDAGDCCPSVLVVTENARFLFNAGDGLQVQWCPVSTPPMHAFSRPWPKSRSQSLACSV